MLCFKLAEALVVEISNGWVTWLKGSCVPAIVNLLVTPFLVYKMFPPKIKCTPDAAVIAKQKLAQMGPLKREEWFMIATMLITVALWISGYVGIHYCLPENFTCSFTFYVQIFSHYS